MGRFTPNTAGLAVARELYCFTDDPPSEDAAGPFWDKPWFLHSALDEITRIWTPAFHRDGWIYWRCHTRHDPSPKRPLLKTLARLLQRRAAVIATH